MRPVRHLIKKQIHFLVDKPRVSYIFAHMRMRSQKVSSDNFTRQKVQLLVLISDETERKGKHIRKILILNCNEFSYNRDI